MKYHLRKQNKIMTVFGTIQVHILSLK